MITPYLRDLINNHKPTTESNNKENNGENKENHEENDRVEWKIQLVMQNNFILKILALCIQQVNLQKCYSITKNGIEFTHESVTLLYFYFQKIDIRRAESYIMSPVWIVSKKVTNIRKMKKIINAFSDQ